MPERRREFSSPSLAGVPSSSKAENSSEESPWGGEQAGNIQGTLRGPFREHSVNIQVELKQTPMGLHPNCKKHIKKAPRLTQNKTCPHGYLRRG
jgi:hypothetical protein